ncbi:HNH endonuclease [Limnohabitans lacus]|uniref:HNH endonuclease n=1 Tax=Limnohabitans lacus TaxID=3045173 RepID=A0ABT6XA80_9BURK|nr:HNH endonuclease [Limnohabitans sp. HM2-2]MDI9235010.1 HNH endonuclease [Limnohabitans sp. HM2-2]
MTVSKKCALCDCLLSGKNRTKEHIIPNAIGGRKKTTEFICNSCNNKLGENWDSELAKQLNWFSLALGISRERGEPPKQIVQTVEGEKYWLLNDGSFTPEKSSYSEENLGGAVKISMTAKTIEEARQRLKGVSRKYPKLDVEKALNELEVKTDFLDSPLHVNLSLGGPDAGRSLVKTAFAFASACGVEHSECGKVIQYLLDGNIEAIPFGFSYLSDFIQNRPKDKIFHCVSLHGDPKTKMLWSYIEYFGNFRIVVLLSDSYSGEYRNEIYSVDPIDGRSVGVRVRSDVSAEELALIWSGDGLSYENYKAAADYALPIILERGRSRTLDRTVKEGFDHAAKQLGIKKDEIIPKEKAAEFTAFMMEKLSPYIAHLVQGSHRSDF